MSPIEALNTFVGRFEAFESATNSKIDRLDARQDEQALDMAAIVKEMELTRRSLDRFTAVAGSSAAAIVAAAVAIILFGPV